jgi:hypothetical protein
LRLLAHHQPNITPNITRYPVPEIPMNLRILAESILNRGGTRMENADRD